MRLLKIKPLIIWPMDPLGNKIGGIGTFLKNFIKYAPEEFEIEWVGVTSDKNRSPIRKWCELSVSGKPIRFFPALYIKDENVRTKIPLSLKFTLALLYLKKEIKVSNRILEFHRIEPALAFKQSPGILFVHGNMQDLSNPNSEVKWSLFPWLYFQLEKRLLNRVNHVFVVREDAVGFYKDRYPNLADRFSFLPTWIDEEAFYPYNSVRKSEKRTEFLAHHRFDSETKLILFVGRLEGAKDPLLLVDTFYHVSKVNNNTRLLVVGAGRLKSAMEKRIKAYQIENKVLFLGALFQEKIAELMRISDLFLLTSAFEGMPRSVLEALGCGLPVVATDVGETRRIVKDRVSGRLVAKREPTALAKAVLDVLNHREHFLTSKIVSCIEPYLARKVLKGIYEKYYELAGRINGAFA